VTKAPRMASSLGSSRAAGIACALATAPHPLSRAAVIGATSTSSGSALAGTPTAAAPNRHRLPLALTTSVAGYRVGLIEQCESIRPAGPQPGGRYYVKGDKQ
jgi:hypothetical protein